MGPTIPRWGWLLLAALAARAVTFGDPVVHSDEQFYYVVADAWRHGALPYVGIWDRKPIGLFLIYLPAAALGYPAGIWAYQAMALAAAVATAALIARLAERAGWSRGALWAGAAYIVWLDLLEGQGGQSPVFYTLPMVAAATLIAPRPDDAEHPRRRFGHGLAALALVGLALQVKYSAVFAGLYFGLWWLWREHRLRASPARLAGGGAVLVAAALAPTVVAWASYAAIGHGGDFAFANFASVFSRHADPLAAQLRNLAVIVATLSPLLAGAVLAWRMHERDGPQRALQRWLLGWALAEATGLLVQGAWFSHYALPLLAPLTILGGGFVAHHRRGREIGVAALALAFVAGQAELAIKSAVRGTPAQFRALAQAVGAGPGCLFVYSGDTMLYAATHRCRVSRYVYPSHLWRLREQGAIGIDQTVELRHILAQRPAVVVIRAPISGERGDVRALLMRRLAEAYRPRAHIPYGRDWAEVYALR